jgi:anaerobic magnesium-protoporphyrin IX monomethyl ester cyclase
MPADITLVNLNMLLLRFGEEVERELHLPLGPLYLTRALEDAGFSVDFRDYQTYEVEEPFDMAAFLGFVADPAPVIGLSCMANLLPFAVLAARALKERDPDRTIVLGGVGPAAVEDKILKRFPWIDVVARGEGEITGPDLLRVLLGSGDLSEVAGVSYRENGAIRRTPDRGRICILDAIPFPAFDRVDLKRYEAYDMMSSRGCPYPCTFCSVAPIWDHACTLRSPRNIVEEMRHVHHETGVSLFLFQDEFFVSGKRQVLEFCRELDRSGLEVKWKAFGRVNLTDVEMMKAMAGCGCVELRFGIESGSDRILQRIRKGFTAAECLDVIPRAIEIIPRVDAFYMWGFPFETMDDFNQTLFQMISFRMMGARILPSVLSLLPQAEIYRELPPGTRLEFCPSLLPEFVFTGHEVLRGGRVEIPDRHRPYFDLVMENPDIFPGFFLVDMEGNILPKLELLRQFGFYPLPEAPEVAEPSTESCGAHSPRIAPAARGSHE